MTLESVPARHAPPGVAANPAWSLLRAGLALALDDPQRGRTELRAALAAFTLDAEPQGRLLAAAALAQAIGIADTDYAGFSAAIDAITATQPALEGIADAGDRLLARSGALVAARFLALEDPQCAPQAEAITRELGRSEIAPALRCCAGISVLSYFEARFKLDSVLWVELAMRPVLAGVGVGQHLRDEWHHALVQALYQCGEPAQANAIRAERARAGPPPVPAIVLKFALLDAQMAIGEGRAQAGRDALRAAEPLLGPAAPRQAGWWHLLSSRLELLESRHRPALTHARLALRLAGESQMPERWMGVTVMQEGQVQMALGAYAEAVPFFERAGRAAAGAQADFCWCLAHCARALDLFAAPGEAQAARDALAQGLALARELHWINFFRPSPAVAAQVCALALEHGIEPAFVHEAIAVRGLAAVRPDLAAWPWPIRVRTLGSFQIELDARALAFGGRAARKPLELLQFAIASGGSDVSAASIMFALWRELEGDRAKSAFNVALHRLRRLLGDDDAVVLELGRLSLNPKRMWVDCLAFEQLADAAGAAPAGPLPAAAAVAAQRALAMYGGHFLPHTDDEPWQATYRSRLASKYKRIAARLAEHRREAGDLRGAQGLLERALELDPLAEDLARALIRLLLDAGEHSAALQVFEQCRAALSKGLAAQPSAATLALVERIRAAG